MIPTQTFSQQFQNFLEHSQETLAVEQVFSIDTPDFMSDFHVIFHVVLFFHANEDVMENSLENVYGGA